MPSLTEKIRILGEHSKYDICASTASSRSENFPTLFGSNTCSIGATATAGVCHSYTPDGRCVSLFKTLFTNKCIYNCKYCFSQTCKQRVSFTPEEYARAFMKLYSMNVVEGLFITSGVNGDADETTKQMLQTVQLLRFKYKFQGYIHFKCLPGVSEYLLKDAINLADRISINLEASRKEYLGEIATQKNYSTDLVTRQHWLKSLRIRHNKEAKKEIADFFADQNIQTLANIPLLQDPKDQKELHVHSENWYDIYGQLRDKNGYRSIRWDNAPILNSGQTTQFVIGAVPDETDYDLLTRLDWGYKEIDLRRGYFSAFSPIKGTPLEEAEATPLDREHRLYQSDWLLRRYHIPIKEMKSIIQENGNLPMGDPKVHLARQYFETSESLDPNTAKYHDLMRVPGIGPISAKRIINLRRNHIEITSRLQLKSLGVVLPRADPFLRINGMRQNTLEKFI